MNITISESDFARALTDAESRRLLRPEPAVPTLGPEEERNEVLDALPKVIAERFRRMLPPNYEIREIELKVAISGTPFGVGISGDATLKFAPKGSSG